MISLKLEYNAEFVILNKNLNGAYIIKNVKDWIFLTKFSSAHLISKHPHGQLETSINKKFVYNQDFELESDLDFKYRYMMPLGTITKNSTSQSDQIHFTGNFNGNGFTIWNINVIDCYNNGLFGNVSSSIIKNLTIKNAIISSGTNNGILAGKASNVEISNINIIGNIIMGGSNCSLLIGIFDGIGKQIKICVDGEINTSQSQSIISNSFYGSIENTCAILNIKGEFPYFNTIGGKLNSSCYVSFNKIKQPFYKISKHHKITDCYYFQLDNDELCLPQVLSNCYYRNLSKRIFIQDKFEKNNNWTEINKNYYLTKVFNYTTDVINSNSNLQFYDVVSGKSNGVDFIDVNLNFVSDDNNPIIKFNKELVQTQCEKMKKIYEKELEKSRINNEIVEKNNKIKLKILLDKLKINSDNKIDESELNESSNLCSEYYTSDEEENNPINLVELSECKKNQQDEIPTSEISEFQDNGKFKVTLEIKLDFNKNQLDEPDYGNIIIDEHDTNHIRFNKMDFFEN